VLAKLAGSIGFSLYVGSIAVVYTSIVAVMTERPRYLLFRKQLVSFFFLLYDLVCS
jgi:hypothetical protein